MIYTVNNCLVSILLSCGRTRDDKQNSIDKLSSMFNPYAAGGYLRQ